MALELKTDITIHATPEQIWSVFADFDKYNEWNPFIKSITGNLELNKKFNAELENMKFKPKLLVFEENAKMEWIGRLFFKGILDGKHSFELIDNGDGTTQFVQNEIFKGILIPLFKKKLLTNTKNEFEAMNIALKKRVEAKVNNESI